jgi:F0F1-type ATP synthase membrane subunit c/vacuolar-type H+-ATPase subunit K
MIAVAAFIGLLGCGAEGALEVRAPIRSQSQSIAPQSPLGVVESFSAPRPVGPGVAKLLETAAKAATVPLAPTALVSERGTRELLMLRRSSLATRSPALVELMAFLAGSTHPEGDAKLQTAIVPTKTIREEFRDGKLYRIAEYTYRGRLITRVQLGTASIGPTTLLNHTHLPPATSFLPTTLLSASTSATSSASGYDFYAEDDSLSIDEVADQVALIDALREEVDLGLWEVEDAYEEWYGSQQVDNSLQHDSTRQSKLAKLCSAADNVLLGSEGSREAILSADLDCVGKASLAIVTRHGTKSMLTAANATRSAWLARYIGGAALRYAVGAGMIMPGALIVAAGAMGWVAYEAVQACRRNPNVDGQSQLQSHQRSLRLAARTRGDPLVAAGRWRKAIGGPTAGVRLEAWSVT